nr:hypothetical protein Iba_chr03bCG4170 [Ipomoea batatas]
MEVLRLLGRFQYIFLSRIQRLSRMCRSQIGAQCSQVSLEGFHFLRVSGLEKLGVLGQTLDGVVKPGSEKLRLENTIKRWTGAFHDLEWLEWRVRVSLTQARLVSSSQSNGGGASTNDHANGRKACDKGRLKGRISSLALPLLSSGSVTLVTGSEGGMTGFHVGDRSLGS